MLRVASLPTRCHCWRLLYTHEHRAAKRVSTEVRCPGVRRVLKQNEYGNGVAAATLQARICRSIVS